MGRMAMRVEDISDVCDDFVTELVQEALVDAERNPDGFAPFAAVLAVDGTQWRNRYGASDDLDATLEEARSELSRVGETARCVAVVWDDCVSLFRGDQEVVHVEAYELGRPSGRVVAMGYRRDRRGVSAIGQLSEQAPTEPIVPLTAELMRRHLGEWADQCRADLRVFVQQFDADRHGYDRLDEHMRAFDDDPRACAPLFDEWLSDFPFGDLSTDDAIALLAPVAHYLAEVLIRTYAGRWDVTDDGEEFSRVIVVDGNDGQAHHVDPFALVREYAEAPLPPLSVMLRRAQDMVHLSQET